MLQARLAGAARDLIVETQPLRGGLVSQAVLHVAAHDRSGRGRVSQFVVKHLAPGGEREADIYRILKGTGVHELAPVSYGVERAPDEGHWLYLEAVAACSRWPWRHLPHAQRVLEALAVLHVRGAAGMAALEADAWSYEAELCERAALTVQAAEHAATLTRDASLRASLPALRRVVTRLPELRRQLMALSALPPALLHGDVHSSNVVIRKRNGKHEPVLLDWGRARVGSPLEDVSSWLQSLAFWEPAVKRKHDTLLASYLRHRGLPAPASRELRDAYWIAAASNGLAGALCHHLTQATAGRNVEPALRAARDWLRVLRRADLRTI